MIGEVTHNRRPFHRRRPAPWNSVAVYRNGAHAPLWFVFYWCLGYEHADRICWMIDAYCRLYKLQPSRLHWWPGAKT